jgi:predicted unusual protein kinase regulating ubiquinone biosynthesis (AarF/ABC1/UbiB family)
MTAFEVVSRSVRFWIQATPIIVHYQFTNAYLTAHPKLRKIPTYTDTDNVIDDDTPKKKKAFLHQPLTKQEIDILRERRQQRRDEIYRNLHETYSPRTLALLLEMRGLFVKIGQVLSSRPDFMPQQYIDQLQSLQDDVPPLNEDEIMDVVREFIWNDHGLDLDEFFEEGKFDGLLGTASIGQVHKATLTQNVYDKIVKENGYKGGRVVAVKVMHHDAEDRFRNDFKILKVSENE